MSKACRRGQTDVASPDNQHRAHRRACESLIGKRVRLRTDVMLTRTDGFTLAALDWVVNIRVRGNAFIAIQHIPLGFWGEGALAPRPLELLAEVHQQACS